MFEPLLPELCIWNFIETSSQLTVAQVSCLYSIGSHVTNGIGQWPLFCSLILTKTFDLIALQVKAGGELNFHAKTEKVVFSLRFGVSEFRLPE